MVSEVVTGIDSNAVGSVTVPVSTLPVDSRGPPQRVKYWQTDRGKKKTICMHLLFTSTNPILQCVSSASEGEKNTESSRVCEAQRYSKEMGERKREILQNSRD